MIVYFDESYDNAREYLLYGALFVPGTSRLQQRIARIRIATEFQPEIKYNRCKNRATLAVCQKVIDAFMDDPAYFHCVVVEQYGFDYSVFGRPDEELALKRARAYKKFAEMLLAPHVATLKNAVFLADDLKRCRGDEFLERIRERFNPPEESPTFRHVSEVSSKLEQYQCLQVCDLLLGCVLNNLKPTRKTTKNEIREYLCGKLKVPNFLYTTWKEIPLAKAKERRLKFHVWYWSARGKPR